MHRSAFRLIAVGVVVLLLLFAAACSGREPTLEERAQALETQIICPVCPGETLDQSRVQIARDMRAILRERLAVGDSEGAIKQFFVDRYGRRILAEPGPSATRNRGRRRGVVPDLAADASARRLRLRSRR